MNADDMKLVGGFVAFLVMMIVFFAIS